MNNFLIPIILCVASSLFEGGVIFLIIYNEDIHDYPERKQRIKVALRGAIITFVIFLVLFGGIFWLSINFLSK